MMPVRANATDELFIHASPEAVQRRLLGLSEDASWWPGARAGGGYGWVTLDVPIGLHRGRMKIKASIPSSRESFKDGTIVHYFLDVERGPGARGRRLPTSVKRHRWAIRRGLNALKDLLEARGAPARRAAR